MNTSPFGPIRPKKPRAKQYAIIIEGTECYGYISSEDEFDIHTEIFSTDDDGEYCIPLDGSFSFVDFGQVEIVNGKIA